MDAMDKPRPSYVQFEVRAVEDRTKSIATGRYVSQDVIFAIVTPAGTKDRLEKPADEWLLGIEEGVKQERIPQEWLFAYRDALKRFKESRENPEFGTSVRDWPALNPSQVKLFLDCNIRTVEDVADMNEEMVGRIGMGARALKEKARAWLDAAADTGQVAGELEELRQKNTDLENRNKDLEERLTKLEALVPKDNDPGPTPPPIEKQGEPTGDDEVATTE